MKTWTNPELQVLNIEATQGGGDEITTHDGVIYTIKVNGKDKKVEGYYS